MIVLLAAALARPVNPELPEARLSSALVQGRAAALRGELGAVRPDLQAAGVQVVVEGPEVGERLRAAGFAPELVVGEHAQLTVPWAELHRIAQLPGVRWVREPHRAESKAVESEGLAEVMTEAWAGVAGAGVEVGIVDVGFAGWEELGAELGAEVTPYLQAGYADSSAHGAAVAEVVHDFAPEAALSLHSFSTDVEFGAALGALVEADVVNLSIGFDNVWAIDGTSSVTQYVDALVGEGVIVVAAAGNEDRKYRVGELALAEGSVAIAGHASVLAPANEGNFRVSFRWSEPFGEAAQDFDLFARDPVTLELCGRSENPQDGNDDPFEEIVAYGCPDEVEVLVVANEGARPEGLTGWLYARGGLNEGEYTRVSSLSLPADCFGCVSVGAWDRSTNDVLVYSSRGPTADGRVKPDIVAPSQVSTVSYGEGEFAGTSAATPHVAGLAALWVDATELRGRPERFGEWLAAGALDLGSEGVDNTFGAGLAQGGEQPPCGCAAGGRAGGLGVLLAALASWRRR